MCAGSDVAADVDYFRTLGSARALSHQKARSLDTDVGLRLGAISRCCTPAQEAHCRSLVQRCLRPDWLGHAAQALYLASQQLLGSPTSSGESGPSQLPQATPQAPGQARLHPLPAAAILGSGGQQREQQPPRSSPFNLDFSRLPAAHSSSPSPGVKKVQAPPPLNGSALLNKSCCTDNTCHMRLTTLIRESF